MPPTTHNEWKLAAVGLAALAIAMLAYALFGRPPYAFYTVFKLTVAAASVACAWAVFSIRRYLIPVSLFLVLIGGVHLFAKMRRADWHLFNWLALAGLAFGAVIIMIALRVRKGEK